MVKVDARQDYYALLGVEVSAGNEQIKRTFRALARERHPDRHPGKESEFVPKFQAIQTAYEILTDEVTRAKYDAERKRLGLTSGSGENRIYEQYYRKQFFYEAFKGTAREAFSANKTFSRSNFKKSESDRGNIFKSATRQNPESGKSYKSTGSYVQHTSGSSARKGKDRHSTPLKASSFAHEAWNSRTNTESSPDERKNQDVKRRFDPRADQDDTCATSCAYTRSGKNREPVTPDVEESRRVSNSGNGDFEHKLKRTVTPLQGKTRVMEDCEAVGSNERSTLGSKCEPVHGNSVNEGCASRKNGQSPRKSSILMGRSIFNRQGEQGNETMGRRIIQLGNRKKEVRDNYGIKTNVETRKKWMASTSQEWENRKMDSCKMVNALNGETQGRCTGIVETTEKVGESGCRKVFAFPFHTLDGFMEKYEKSGGKVYCRWNKDENSVKFVASDVPTNGKHLFTVGGKGSRKVDEAKQGGEKQGINESQEAFLHEQVEVNSWEARYNDKLTINSVLTSNETASTEPVHIAYENTTKQTIQGSNNETEDEEHGEAMDIDEEISEKCEYELSNTFERKENGKNDTNLEDGEKDAFSRLKELAESSPFTNNKVMGVEEGLDGFSDDLKSTLPFPSQASSLHPIQGKDVNEMRERVMKKIREIAQPPKEPPIPINLNQKTWNRYKSMIEKYMQAWEEFNSKMLKHFMDRQEQLMDITKRVKAGEPDETQDEFLRRIDPYMEGIKEDDRIRMYWNVANEKHSSALQTFAEIRERAMKNRH